MRVVDGGFEWTADDRFSPERYAEVPDLVGGEAYQALFRSDDPLGAFAAFLDATREARHRAYRPARLFISHKHEDTAAARALAGRARRANVPYWLDVENPILGNVGSAHQAVATAVIIEMALLNCCAVIALHTANSRESRWIPYELGRVKEHFVFSPLAAVWFDDVSRPLTGQEYLELALKTCDPGRTPPPPWVDVDTWLGHLASAGGRAVAVRPARP